MRIGVSGLGSIGCRHARLLVSMPGIETHGFDPHGVPEHATADLAGLASVAPSFEALLERAPDGLIVATPDALHVEQAAMAMRAGVPVLIEKPLADGLDAARSIAELGATSGVPAMVGYVLRHHGAMRRFRTALDDGAIGAPISFHATLSAHETLVVARNRFRDDDRFRLVFDYSHEWDYLQWLFGPVTRCAATARTVANVTPTQTPNTIDAILEFSAGVTGTVHLDYVGSSTRRCRVIGAEGVIEADMVDGSVRVLRHGEDERVDIVREERDAAFVRQLEHFVEVASGRAAPVVSLGDGVNAIAVAEAVVTACRERRWVDRLPLGRPTAND